MCDDFDVNNGGATPGIGGTKKAADAAPEKTFQKCRKTFRKLFLFLDNSVWLGCVKLFLLTREYLSSAVNVLRNSLKIFHITKIDFFQVICLRTEQWIS